MSADRHLSNTRGESLTTEQGMTFDFGPATRTTAVCHWSLVTTINYSLHVLHCSLQVDLK
jgi:hypothetical protein